jgi:ribosomal-protein-alanine N-acetyltransferase
VALRVPRIYGAPAIPEPWADARIEIVPMRRRHVRAVAAIEEQIFPRPWSPSLYYSEIAQGPTRCYLVALVAGAVVGYAGSIIVAGEGHITTVGVAPNWHRRGVATRLLLALCRESIARGARALTLEVRMSNLGAQRLYQEFGFVPAGVRRNYYAEVNEDGLVMWAHDVDTSAYGDRLAAIEARLSRFEGTGSGKAWEPEQARGDQAGSDG